MAVDWRVTEDEARRLRETVADAVVEARGGLTEQMERDPEATLTLGGTTRTFWGRVAIPVLAPSFLASFLLLFANAFSSYATAAALASQGAQIVPLQIRAALTSETVLGRENLAGALAFGMVVVMALVMWAYSAVQRRAARWQG